MQHEQVALEGHPMLPYPSGRFRRCVSAPTRSDAGAPPGALCATSPAIVGAHGRARTRTSVGGGAGVLHCHYAVRPNRTTSFSLDEVTLRNLKALAARRHKGNVSALLAELATREAKFAAAEAFFERYGVPPLDEKALARIEKEWRGEAPSKKARRRAA
jgi:hypothetical protein